MTTRKPFFQERFDLRNHCDAVFVQAEEYCRLLLSWRKMERIEDKAGNVCGLFDVQSGKSYLIERERLLSAK